ncbi:MULTISPECIES: response regulator [Methylotenera]|uniref:response regulator n=1 Tax=Methylotenera TaxID=359407 RepID=UPI000379CBB0|nr:MULTISPECIES: response regulator [Methylotenera]
MNKYHTYPKPRVLIAEDHAVNQEVIKAILSHDGYEFMVVDNGLEAIELLEQEIFDVILMDMQMPVMDGCQAAMEIRKREEVSGGRVRIIAITANATKGDREICMSAGMDDYITKPIDAQILIAKLSSNSQHDETEIIHKETPKLSVTNASIFNAESLKGRVLGQSVPSMKMVPMFLKELPNSLADLDLALKANNIDEIAKLAHRMGGVAAMLGAEQMALVAEELEADARVGATKTLPDLIAKMHLASIPLKEKLLQFVRQN